MKDPQEVIHTYLTDMHAVESHILEAVERQLEGDEIKAYPEASRVVRTLQTTLKRHTDALQATVEAREGKSIKGALKEALGDTLGFVAGLYDKVRDDKVSRMIRDNYTATSLAAISYHMLHTTALGLKNQEVAQHGAAQPEGPHADPRRSLEGRLRHRCEGTGGREQGVRWHGRAAGHPQHAGSLERRPSRGLNGPLPHYGRGRLPFGEAGLSPVTGKC